MKMVMDGGASKETFAAGVSKINDLQNHTAQFDDEYAAYD
jgi:hypothetical protein